MKRILGSVAIIMVLLIGPAAASAQEPGPVMDVTVGFDGYCRAELWCPVVIVLANEGPDVEGTLRVDVGDDDYDREVTLPTHSRKAYTVYLPPWDLSRDEPEVRLLDGSEVVASHQIEAVLLVAQDRLYGAVSSDPSALNYLSDVTPVGARAYVAHLDLAALPPDPLGWEALDVLVLADVDTTALSDAQLEALQVWISHGGHLVVSGGGGAAATAAGLSDLLPGTVGGTRSVDVLTGLGDYADAEVAEGPYAVAETTLGEGQVLVEHDGLVLAARRRYGVGRVDLFAYDLGVNPFVRWDDNTRFWEQVVGTRRSSLQPVTVHNGAAAIEALGMIPGLGPPSLGKVVVFLLLYILLIGPVNYLVLRKLDRRELAWITIPLLIVGFSVFAYLTGLQLRGGETLVHQLTAVYVPANAQVGRATRLVGVFSPSRARYDVRAPGTGVRQLPLVMGYGVPDPGSLTILDSGEGPVVSDLLVDVGGMRSFVSEGYEPAPPIETDLELVSVTASAWRLDGRLRNGDVPLSGAALIIGDDALPLGDLAAGEEETISRVVAGTGTGAGSASEAILDAGSHAWDADQRYSRGQFLAALFTEAGTYYGPYVAYGPSSMPYGVYDPYGLPAGVYLVGWVEGGEAFPVDLVDRPFSSLGATLVIYELPVTAAAPESAIVPSSLVEREWVSLDSGVELEGWSGEVMMSADSEAVCLFTVGGGLEIDAVDGLVLELSEAVYYDQSAAKGPPEVSVWSWSRGDWDELEVRWGRTQIPDPGGHFHPVDGILLRLKATDDTLLETVDIEIRGQ